MGRASISEKLTFDDLELEHIHDLVPWVFSSPEAKPTSHADQGGN
jgi:hypothetical protein